MRLQVWDQLEVDSCVGSICESCTGKDVSWSSIVNHLDLRETFDVVSSQLLESGEHILVISYISILSIEVAGNRCLFTNWLDFTAGWSALWATVTIYSCAIDPSAGSLNTLYNLHDEPIGLLCTFSSDLLIAWANVGYCLRHSLWLGWWNRKHLLIYSSCSWVFGWCRVKIQIDLEYNRRK